MAEHDLTFDTGVPLASRPLTGHNRWHPGIPPVLTVSAGDTVTLSTRDGYDGQFDHSSTAEDVAAGDMNRIHPLTGPIFVDDAQPGDVLVIDILEVSTGARGYTLQFPGFGFLHEDFERHHIVRWDMADGLATSPDLPGVTIPGAPFPGVIGLAPSAPDLDLVNRQERAVAAHGGTALPPEPASAVPSAPDIAMSARRTISPSRTGGNIDIRQLTAGSRLFLPVRVAGALLSIGDGHFAQGDGESCGAAIETTCLMTVRVGVQRSSGDGDPRWITFERRTAESRPSLTTAGPYHAVAGMPVLPDGGIDAENLSLAARNALRGMIRHLEVERGFTPQQAYALCSVAVDLKVSQVVDVPNVIVTAFLPTSIFSDGR